MPTSAITDVWDQIGAGAARESPLWEVALRPPDAQEREAVFSELAREEYRLGLETILGAFEAEEILYELREHASGLNCGRWDYIFSFVKKLRNRPEYLFPDRTLITMTVPFMRAYALHVIDDRPIKEVARITRASSLAVKNRLRR